MAFFNEFPHSRTYDSDLGWLIGQMKRAIDTLASLVESDAEHSAAIERLQDDIEYIIEALQQPITEWSASNTYKQFQLVEYQGTIYIALKDVPVGVGIGDTEYWSESGNVYAIIAAMQTAISNNTEDIDIIQTAIDALKPDRFYISSLGENPTFADMQTAINDHAIIVFDVDASIGSNTFSIGSDKEIYAINGATISGDGVIFDLTGDLTDTGITASIDSPSAATLSAALPNDKRYLFLDTVDASTYGYPYFPGTHTANSLPPHYGFFTNIIGEGTAVRLTDVYDAPLSAAIKVYEFMPVENVRIHDITINSALTTETAGIINIMRCRHITLDGIVSIKSYGFNIVAQESEYISILNSSMRDDTDTASQLFHLNVLRIGGVINGMAQNCSAIGTQPIDITYSDSDHLNIISAFITIEDCEVYGTQTGITTHPGTYHCIIAHNTIYSAGDGIALRGTLHDVYDNMLYYLGDYATDYGIGSVAGCLCMTVHDNKIFRYPIAMQVSEDANNPFNNSGTPFIIMRDNFIQSCAICYMIDITGDATYRPLNADFSGNSFNGLSTLSATPRRFLYVRGAGTSIIQHVNILKNQINNMTFNQALVECATAKIRRLNIEIFSSISAALDNSYIGTVTQSYLAIYGTATIITTGTKLPTFTNLNA